MSTSLVGLLGALLFILLLALSMPVGFAMAIAGCLGFALISNPGAACHMLSSVFFETFSKYDYTVIPLFIFMGQVCFHSGISKRLFDTAYKCVGRLPGGMATATVAACAAFGAICGSGPATAATMAAVTLPEMKKRNYCMQLASGTVASAGSLGMMIPPSVVFIVYGFLTEQSPAKLFIAGIIPGLMFVLLFIAYITWKCIRNPQLGPASPPSSWKEKLHSLLGVIDPLLLFIAVIGGMFLGWFTPTEAASVGALGSLVIAACRKSLSWSMLKRSLMETIRSSCMILLIIAGAMVFSRFLALSRIPTELASALTRMQMPGWLIIACILATFVILGTVVDSLALVLMTIPVFLPLLSALKVDLIWFGVLVVAVVQVGVISPPVGICAYVVSGLIRDVSLQSVFKGCIPYMGMLVIGIILLMLFPALATWLPAMM
ncbi:MAG: TRAP transporter large permease [Lentisphaeria bacterium]